MTKLSEWNPFRTPNAMFTAPWNEMMTRFFPTESMELAKEFQWMPKVDVKETPENFLISAEAPGIKPENIHVQVTADTVRIWGEKKDEHREEKDQWHVVERRFGSFNRTFTLPVAVDPDHVDATTKDGILTVKLAKSKVAGAKKVTVRPA